MRIGVAGPCSIELLSKHLNGNVPSERVYSFPYIAQLVDAYISRGHTVDLFVGSTDIDRPKMLAEGPALRIFAGRRRSSGRAMALDGFKIERRDITDLMRSAAPEVVHSHWLYEFSSAALSYDPTTLVTAHDDPFSVLKHYHHPYWWLRETLAVSTLLRAKRLTAVAPSLGQALAKFPFAPRQIHVIPNGLASNEPHAPRADRDQPVAFATVANGFDKRKNTATALAAFAQARRQPALQEAELLMFGFGHEDDGPAARWSRSHGISDGVHFHGSTPHSQLLAILRDRVDVLVHTSRWEACSLAILEAQSQGVTVIGGSRSGGVSYTLGYGRTGILADVTNINDVARQMVLTGTDPQLRQRLRGEAQTDLSQQFSLDSVADAYLALLSERVN